MPGFKKSWFTLGYYKLDKKQTYFREWYALDYLCPSLGMVKNAGTPPPQKKKKKKKCFFQKMWFIADIGFP